MAAKKRRAGSVFAKYRVLLISITAFLLLIAALLGLNLYSSLQIGQDTAKINASAYMRDLTQSITRDLFNLRLSYGEDPNTPHMSTTIGRLEKNISLYDRNLKAMKSGGQLVDADGDVVEVEPDTLAASEQEVNALEQEWAQFYPVIRTYLRNARTINASLTDLDLAVNQSQSSSIALAEDVNTIASEIKTAAYDRASLLTYLQFFGILAIIVYFLIFIFFVLRQLLSSDKEAEDARQETTEILETVSEGLFLVDENLEIGSQHSKALNHMLGIEEISGKSLNSLLEEIITAKDMTVTAEFIEQLFNPRVKEKLIRDLNPLDRIRAGISDERGQIKTRYLKFGFSRVYNGDDIVRVLISVADITNTIMLEQRLERERIQNDEQVEMLTAILKVDERMINSFLRNAQRSTDRINDILRDPSFSQQALKSKARDIFREAHSLKGEASALGLQSFVSSAEELEDKVKPLNDKAKLVGDDFIPLAVSLEQLITTLERVDDLVKKIGGFGAQDSAEGGHTLAQTLSDKRHESSDMDGYFSHFGEQIAERNDKKVSVVAKGFDQVNLDEEQSDLLKDLAIQLLRNAIVHGIEAPEERLAQDKDEQGHIRMQLSFRDDNMFDLVVEDDGRGINYPKIREMVRQTRQLSEAQAAELSEKQLLVAMFSSGFSTLSRSNQDGGRGVGTDVIKARLRELGGKVNVASKAGQFTRFTVRFPKDIGESNHV